MPSNKETDCPGPRRRRSRVLTLLVVAGIVAFGLGQAAPVGAQAQTARIRLAHFSPDTPEMDVYVVGFEGEEQRVLQGLGFGDVSDYASLEGGEYSFLLRPMGAPADSTPAVTASATLEDGAAYTFAAMGPQAELQKALLTDDLAPPPAGQAKVRLIQASSSAGEVDLAIVNGPTLAENQAFATATDYAPVDAGQWTVRLTTGGGSSVERRLDITAGTVNTLVVLEGENGPELSVVVDATGVDASSGGALGARPAMPLGGVGTGGGATADRVVGGDSANGAIPVSALLVMAAGLAVLAAVAVVARGRTPSPESPTAAAVVSPLSPPQSDVRTGGRPAA